MEPPSDLIDHFKLNAHHTNGVTTETSESYSADPTKGIRKVKVNRKWHRGRSLGHGAFGAVWLEEHADGNKEPTPKTARAVKEVSKPFMRAVDIDYNRELLALAKLSKFAHAFVEFHGWFESDHLVFLVMEYVPHGDLVGFIQNGIGEAEGKVIAGQLLEGLAVMHRYHFTHRDLKPSNIFVKSPPPHWWIKIGDFGITKRVSNEQTALRTELGSRSFQAPEVAGITGDYGDYSNSVDIWSLGCVIHKILTGAVPFENITALESYCSSRTEFPTTILKERDLSDGGVEFLRRLLAVKPDERPTAIVAAEDQWLQVEDMDGDSSGDMGDDNNSQTSQSAQNYEHETELTPEDGTRTLEEFGTQSEDRPSLVENHSSSSAKGDHAPESTPTIIPLSGSTSLSAAEEPKATTSQGQTTTGSSDPESLETARGKPGMLIRPLSGRRRRQVKTATPEPQRQAASASSEESTMKESYLLQTSKDADRTAIQSPFGFLTARAPNIEGYTSNSKERQLALEFVSEIRLVVTNLVKDPNARYLFPYFTMISRFDDIYAGHDLNNKAISVELFEVAQELAPKPAGPPRIPNPDLQKLISHYREDPLSLDKHEWIKVLAWTVGWPHQISSVVKSTESTNWARESAPRTARSTPSLEDLISRYREDAASLSVDERDRVIAWTGGHKRPEHIPTDVKRQASMESTPKDPIKVITRSARPTPSIELLIPIFCDDPFSMSSQEQDRVLAYTGWPMPQAEQRKRSMLKEPVSQGRVESLPDPTRGREQGSLRESRLATPSLENMIKLYCETPGFLTRSDRQRVLEWTGWPHTNDFYPDISVKESVAQSEDADYLNYLNSEDLTRSAPSSDLTYKAAREVRRSRFPPDNSNIAPENTSKAPGDNDFSYITSKDLAQPPPLAAPSRHIIPMDTPKVYPGLGHTAPKSTSQAPWDSDFGYITSKDLGQPPLLTTPNPFTTNNTSTPRRRRSPVSRYPDPRRQDISQHSLYNATSQYVPISERGVVAPSPYIPISERGGSVPAPENNEPAFRDEGVYVASDLGLRPYQDKFDLPQPADDRVVEEQFIALMHRNWQGASTTAKNAMLAYPVAKKWTFIEHDRRIEEEAIAMRTARRTELQERDGSVGSHDEASTSASRRHEQDGESDSAPMTTKTSTDGRHVTLRRLTEGEDSRVKQRKIENRSESHPEERLGLQPRRREIDSEAPPVSIRFKGKTVKLRRRTKEEAANARQAAIDRERLQMIDSPSDSGPRLHQDKFESSPGPVPVTRPDDSVVEEQFNALLHKNWQYVGSTAKRAMLAYPVEKKWLLLQEDAINSRLAEDEAANAREAARDRELLRMIDSDSEEDLGGARPTPTGAPRRSRSRDRDASPLRRPHVRTPLVRNPPRQSLQPGSEFKTSKNKPKPGMLDSWRAKLGL